MVVTLARSPEVSENRSSKRKKMSAFIWLVLTIARSTKYGTITLLRHVGVGPRGKIARYFASRSAKRAL